MERSKLSENNPTIPDAWKPPFPSFGMQEANVRKMLCQRLEFASMRITGSFEEWPDGTKNRQHSKVYMVDDVAYYIGSKNAYPATLQEFGYVVEDPVSASEFLEEFWDPQWEYSKAGPRNATVLDMFTSIQLEVPTTPQLSWLERVQ